MRGLTSPSIGFCDLKDEDNFEKLMRDQASIVIGPKMTNFFKYISVRDYKSWTKITEEIEKIFLEDFEQAQSLVSMIITTANHDGKSIFIEAVEGKQKQLTNTFLKLICNLEQNMSM